MISDKQLNKVKTAPNLSDIPLLVAEVERLRKSILDYGTTVNQKLDSLETNMLKLDAENSRLVMAKSVIALERDACVGLVTQMAKALGWKSGQAPINQAVLDLPSGQVSWTYTESEAHLFSHLEPYSGIVEELDITEKYRRVMDPKILLDF